jgi:hypothetical protein
MPASEPDLILEPYPATQSPSLGPTSYSAAKAVLVAIHVISALIVVPSLARQVRSTSDRTPIL